MGSNAMGRAKAQEFVVDLEALANQLEISDGYRGVIALLPLNQGVLNRRCLWVLLQLNRQGISDWGALEALQKVRSQVVALKR